MNDDKKILKVNIFGSDYPLKVDADIDHIHKVAEYVDKRMREIQAAKPSRPVHQIAILAALNITDELFQAKQNDQEPTNFEDRLLKLTQQIELGIKKLSEDNEDSPAINFDTLDSK